MNYNKIPYEQMTLRTRQQFRYRFDSPSDTRPNAVMLKSEYNKERCLDLSFVKELPQQWMEIRDKKGKIHRLYWREDMKIYEC